MCHRQTFHSGKRVIAQHVHIKTQALADQRQADPARSNHSDCLTRDFVAEKRKKWMSCAPLLLAHHLLAVPHAARESSHHQKGKLRGCVIQYLRRVGEWDPAMIGVSAIDIVKSYGNLRHHFQRGLPCLEHSRIDRIAKRGNQSVYPANFFQD